jgi:heme oxygenase (biliverdin-producing, ferredoxin)
MSMVLERVEESKKRLKENLVEQLAAKSLSTMVRRNTWADHDVAQFSPFELSLAQGTISKEGYAELLANVYPVYIALEARLESFANDPLVGQFHIPELARASFIAKDLEYYYGPDWRDHLQTLDTTQDYIDRVNTVDQVGFIAHHYTRYLADLSGGIMIAMALRSCPWYEEGKGLDYYDFTEIGDANGFKNAYRDALDNLPITAEQKLDMIHEVMVAYEFNIEMGRGLAAKHIKKVSLEG